MVSRETFKTTNTLSPDFVAGIISTSGTFFHTHTARVEQFGFQIKMRHENYELLRMIRDVLGITNHIHIYREGNTRYAILLTRSKKTLTEKIIPFVDERIYGQKLKDYLQWKKNLLLLSNN